jgi:hypothetical protein
MSEENEAPDDSPSAVSNRTMELVVAGLLFLFGVVVATESWKLGARWASDGPGAGYFPFYIGCIVAVSSLMNMINSFSGKNRAEGSFVSRWELKQVMSVLIPAIIYVALIQFLGIYIASAIYIALFMIILGNYPLMKSVAVGVLVNVVFFLMFEVWFKVPLFKGSLNLLGFLGY